LLVPVALVLLLDLERRSDRLVAMDHYYRGTYLASLLEAALVWGLLVYAASRRRGVGRVVSAALFVIFLTFAVGGQTYFFEQYHAYLNVDVSLFASNFVDSIINQLVADLPNYLAAKLPVLAFAVFVVWVGRHWVRPRRLPGKVVSVIAPLAMIASFFIPTQHRHMQASTPDMLYMHAVGGLLRTQAGMTDQSNQLRPRARQSLPVMPVESKPRAPRNVMFIILESVRADSTCQVYSQGCQETQYTNALLPERYPLTQMRSLASSTAISLAVLWAGVGPHESRDVLHTWPLIFDYAKAAGYETAFWTSQNMMFGNARLWVKNLGVSRFCSATDLDPTADLDMGAPEGLLADRVNQEIGELKEPFLAVVQLSNVHYPYLLDPEGPQPFQPSTTSKSASDNEAFKNLYKNAVHQQDQHVASMLRHLKNSDAGKRTVIVYTSDHAEAFREHGQMGHTFSVFDEEVKVPSFIDAPPGTLTQTETEALSEKRDAFTFHPDLAVTVMDLMGVWDDPALGPYKGRILGKSLLRPGANERAMPMTNCAGVWSCAFENWGYMRKHMKLEARAWDTGWKCYDLLQDPFENANLGSEACGDLLQHALGTFKRLPGGERE
jgi:glucan phosphoethanolaminetransferase (alkaline phosphatase superfamily)